MKKSKVISLVLLLFLVLALTLISSGNVSALGAGDFFLTDEELPSGWKRYTQYELGYKTWPAAHMGVRTKLMGGYWAGKLYGCGDGVVTVCVGYYPTEEEAKKWMNPDVYIYETDIYAATGHQGTTLSEWAQQSTKYNDRIFSSGTAYGDEGFTVQDITYTIYGDEKGTAVFRVNIFRIRNVIFHVVRTEGVLEPLLVKKARRLLGEEVSCGDGKCQEGEDCFVCPEDCKCGPKKICDPFHKYTAYTNPKTKCSSKMAYIFISTDPNLDWRHKLMMMLRADDIQKFYEKEGYKVGHVFLQGTEHEVLVKNKKTKDKIWVANEKEFVERLAKPSTKAIAFFGHGGSRTYNSRVPFCDTWIPTLGGHSANKLWNAVFLKRKSEYIRLGLNEKDAGKKAAERDGEIGLDYAYMFACHSLDDNSLRDFLVRKGGTYWGEQGILTGIWWLEESKRTE